MTGDKTLNFWNNVKTVPAYVEERVGNPTNTNFLAGDIVKDGQINIYDLSAVVSYFGTDGLSVSNHPEYAKYDLNRDGVIDSKDVAYVSRFVGKVMSVTLNQPRASLIHISPEPQKFENTGLPQNPIGFVGRETPQSRRLNLSHINSEQAQRALTMGRFATAPYPKRTALIMPFCENLVKYSNTQAVICLFIF